MENIALVIITALISGLLATLVTIWWQRRAGIFASKMRIFETLMSYRYMISSEESVKALNSNDIIFYYEALKLNTGFITSTTSTDSLTTSIISSKDL